MADMLALLLQSMAAPRFSPVTARLDDGHTDAAVR